MLTPELAFEAGLHRCPDRYPSTFTSSTDREMRKRVFWSLYTLDRLLTAEFGVPIMLHDTDVDTCVPGGSERHPLCPPSPDGHPARADEVKEGRDAREGRDSPEDRRKRRRSASPGRERINSAGAMSSPRIGMGNTLDGTYMSNIAGLLSDTTGAGGSEQNHQPPEPQRQRLLPAFSLVGISRLMGQAMEAFNKSLRHRSIQGEPYNLRC